MADILDRIVAVKREEVAAAKALRPLEAVQREARARRDVRNFGAALRSRVDAGQVPRQDRRGLFEVRNRATDAGFPRGDNLRASLAVGAQDLHAPLQAGLHDADRERPAGFDFPAVFSAHEAVRGQRIDIAADHAAVVDGGPVVQHQGGDLPQRVDGVDERGRIHVDRLLLDRRRQCGTSQLVIHCIASRAR